MVTFYLHTRSGLHRVSQQGVERVSSPRERRVHLIGPSLTYRKHFSIPPDVTRNRSDVRKEIFSRSLPGSLTDFRPQFLVLSESEAEGTRIIGWAVRRDVVDSLRDQFPEPEGVYFLERLLCETSFDESTRLRIPFPDGEYVSVMEKKSLWSRFLQDPDESSRSRTEQYINDRVTEGTQQRALPSFDASEEGKNWSRALIELLPAEPPRGANLLSVREVGAFERRRWKAWSLVGVFLLAAVSFYLVETYEQIRLEAWMNRQYGAVFEREPRYPYRELRSRVTRMEQSDRSAGNRYALKFPRLVRVDSAVGERKLRLLRFSIDNRRTRLIFLVPSLEVAEEFLQTLRDDDWVREASIQSTDSVNLQDHRFEVNASVAWKKGIGRG